MTADADDHARSPAVVAAAALLAEHAGVLEYGERATEVRFVSAEQIPLRDHRRHGGVRLILGVPPSVFDAEEHVLFAPDTAEPSVQVMLEVRPADRLDFAADRWAAYHGTLGSLSLADGAVESVRVRTGADDECLVVDGDEVSRHVIGLRDELVVLRFINEDAARLAAVCRRERGFDVADPKAVGADRLGIDVRARFGVIRLAFADPAADAAEVRRRVERLLGA